ncbi:unnamed protein product [Rhizophagus irregularis]|uniref:Uncharacterized protein n=1 Tax=Rhizophagus irregularis TaxID=588596 RepID=A0A915ZYR2_9GLOM|nr:unnamed protein product [Rhizophagus irregularis]
MAKDKVRRKALTTKQSQNSQEPKNVANTEIVVSEADKIAAKLSAAKSTKASLKQPRRSRQKNKKTDHQTQEMHQMLIDGLKRSLEQNKEIFKAIHETKIHIYSGCIGPLCYEVIKAH